MTLHDILTSSGGVVLVLLTLIQLAPVKLNPWSALGRAIKAVGRAIGKVFNSDVIEKLDKMEAGQKETRQRLDEHIRMDDERNADMHRARILQFNTELLRGIRHTEEDFNEILYNIDCYERYCTDHPEYQNNRAVHAIKHISGVYDKCMEQHDFL